MNLLRHLSASFKNSQQTFFLRFLFSKIDFTSEVKYRGPSTCLQLFDWKTH